MADPTYYAVLTKAGADLEARALETGKGVVLTHIAVGDANRKEIGGCKFVMIWSVFCSFSRHEQKSKLSKMRGLRSCEEWQSQW